MKVEAAEVTRILSMLEEEVERREQGDTKIMEIAKSAEEVCKEINNAVHKELAEFTQSEAETSAKYSVKPKKMQINTKFEKENYEPILKENSANQYLKTFEKSLTRKLQKGLDNIAKIVGKTYVNPMTRNDQSEEYSDNETVSQIQKNPEEIPNLEDESLNHSEIASILVFS